MKPTTLAGRAILAEYAKKTLRPFEIVSIVVFVLMILGATFLIIEVSGWWWLLMAVVLAYGAIGSLAWLILHSTIDKIRPDQTTEQQKSVKLFVKKLNSVADSLKISQFSLLLRVVRDVMSRGDKNILTDFAQDSSDLAKELQSVVNKFQ